VNKKSNFARLREPEDFEELELKACCNCKQKGCSTICGDGECSEWEAGDEE
jgi:hypothetical protein